MLILLVGIGLRILYLDSPAKWDESVVWSLFTKHDYKVILNVYNLPTNHVFYTLISHTSYLFWGNALWTLRLPALVCGIGQIYLVFRYLKNELNVNIALVATAFASTSSLLIEFSVNARGYSFVGLVFLLSLNLLRKIPSKTKLFVFSCVSAFGFFTMPSYIIPFTIVSLLYLQDRWNSNDGKDMRGVIYEFLFFVGLSAVISIILYSKIIIYNGIGGIWNAMSFEHYNELFWERLGGELYESATSVLRDIPAIGIFFYVICMAIGIFNIRYRRRLASIFIILILSCALWIGITRIAAPPRVFIFAFPIVYAAIATGIYELLLKVGKTRLDTNVIGVSLLIVFAHGYFIIRGDSLYSSRLTGGFPLAETVTNDFRSMDSLNDSQIMTEMPTTFPLKYYFDRLEMNSNVIIDKKSEFNPSKQTYVVIDREIGQQLKDFKARFDVIFMEEPIVVVRHEGYRIYSVVARK